MTPPTPSPSNASLAALDALPREPLAMTPTPLVRLEVLERVLAADLGREVSRIFAKLDAYTGFGLGGNKVRKLEYVVAPERRAGATHLVTAGGVQSNHARVTAAVAARLGLGCVLVLSGSPPSQPRGNARLHRMFGAEVITVADRDARERTMERVAEDIASSGGQALSIPLGASTPLGALGYVRAAREFAGQATDAGLRNPVTFLSSSSGGTLAGLVLGSALVAIPGLQLVAVSADEPRDRLLGTAREVAEVAGLRLGWSGSLDAVDVAVTDDHVGPGYGLPTRESERATEWLARHAGIVLDPTYTSKAAAGLIAWIRTGRVTPDRDVVFWHTGGWPAAV